VWEASLVFVTLVIMAHQTDLVSSVRRENTTGWGDICCAQIAELVNIHQQLLPHPMYVKIAHQIRMDLQRVAKKLTVHVTLVTLAQMADHVHHVQSTHTKQTEDQLNVIRVWKMPNRLWRAMTQQTASATLGSQVPMA